MKFIAVALVLSILLIGCGGDEKQGVKVDLDNTCGEQAECEDSLESFIQAAALCFETSLTVYHNFGSNILTTNNSDLLHRASCDPEDDQSIEIIAKIEQEFSSYSVYSCDLTIVKFIDWNTYPKSEMDEFCTYVREEDYQTAF